MRNISEKMYKFFLIYTILIFGISDAFRMGSLECAEDPQPVPSSTLKCDQKGCRIECEDHFRFPRGERVLELSCSNRQKWSARNYGSIPECEPICSPACLNGGKCVGPNQCYCSNNYSGHRCQTRIQTCSDKVPMPSNTMGKCITSSNGIQSCKVTCVEGYKFPDGTLTADLRCRSGQWSMEPRTFKRCEPYCNPICQNGGTCVGLNLCQCTETFRGDQCQYSIDRCSPKKIGFNGTYRCSGNAESMECKLSCPSGSSPTHPLATLYTCKYDEGIYRPQQAPQCNYGGMTAQYRRVN